VARLLGRLSRRLPAEDGRGRDRSRCRSDRGCIRRQTEMEEVLLRSAITATWSSACAPAFRGEGMVGARGARGNQTFQRAGRVQPCIRPWNAAAVAAGHRRPLEPAVT
jgi:hypothetical protein